MKTGLTDKYWSVYSRDYEVGTGSHYEPPGLTCSYAEVFAPTVRAAKVAAVKIFRKNGELDYCDGGTFTPFKNLKVEEIHPCSEHNYHFEECEMGQCIPYYCEVCEGDIEPIGTEKPYSGGAYGQGDFAHELCLLPEERHAEIVFGEGYFA